MKEGNSRPASPFNSAWSYIFNYQKLSYHPSPLDIVSVGCRVTDMQPTQLSSQLDSLQLTRIAGQTIKDSWCRQGRFSVCLQLARCCSQDPVISLHGDVAFAVCLSYELGLQLHLESKRYEALSLPLSVSTFLVLFCFHALFSTRRIIFYLSRRYGELTARTKRSMWKMFLHTVQDREGVLMSLDLC